MVKNLSACAGDTRATGLIRGGEDPLEKVMAAHSSILAWGNSMDRGGWWLQSMGSQRVRHE